MLMMFLFFQIDCAGGGCRKLFDTLRQGDTSAQQAYKYRTLAGVPHSSVDNRTEMLSYSLVILSYSVSVVNEFLLVGLCVTVSKKTIVSPVPSIRTPIYQIYVWCKTLVISSPITLKNLNNSRYWCRAYLI